MLAKLNIRYTVLVVLLGLLINNGFSKTIGLSSGFIELERVAPLDSSKTDSITSDSLINLDISPNAPKFRVKYTANDSIDFDNTNQIVYLFGVAKVEYGKISLEADRIVVYIGKNEVHAFGKRDSTGKLTEKVKFNDDGQTFEAPEMAYNFNSKKGRIIQATTQQGEMYLLSDEGKKMANDDIFLKTGKITTCDAEHPHFYFEASKLKVIPGKKIVVGPTNLIIRELRTPLVIPFGMFPSNQKKQSGILIPGYASGANGYGLNELGFHWAINDTIHAEFLTDIFFNGTYRASADFNYKIKYKFNGKLGIKYNNIVQGTKDLKDHKISRDYNVVWTFNQDAKAHPKRKVGISINYKSPTFNQTQNINSQTASTLAQGYSRSSVNWGWNDKKWSLNTTSNLDQNFSQSRIDMTLPNINFSVRPIKAGIFTIGGSAQASNKVSRSDSTFFTNETFDHIRNGAKANINIRLSERWTIAKYLIVTTPTLNWNSYFITEELRKIQGVNGLENDTLGVGRYAYDVSIGNFGFNTKVFGTYQMNNQKGYVKAFRHTITPSANLTWRPDWFMQWQDINVTTTNTVDNRLVQYSRYSTAIYSPNASKAASVNFSLDQNLQAKVRDRGDSTRAKYNTVDLINALRVNSSYNFLSDSLNWSNLSFLINTRPGLLKNFNIQGNINPYSMDEDGNTYNVLLWKNKKTGRLTYFRAETAIDLKRLNFVNWLFGGTQLPKDNFNWSLDLRYTFTYNKPGLDASMNQSLGIGGRVTLSKNWSFVYNLPINLESGQFSNQGYFNIKRDLHCWEMTFNYFPFQDQTWYTFTIRPKAGLLQDLKYDKNRRGDRVF